MVEDLNCQQAHLHESQWHEWVGAGELRSPSQIFLNLRRAPLHHTMTGLLWFNEWSRKELFVIVLTMVLDARIVWGSAFESLSHEWKQQHLVSVVYRYRRHQWTVCSATAHTLHVYRVCLMQELNCVCRCVGTTKIGARREFCVVDDILCRCQCDTSEKIRNSRCIFMRSGLWLQNCTTFFHPQRARPQNVPDLFLRLFFLFLPMLLNRNIILKV